MSRLTYDVSMHLENIICHEEGDGWGSAEPYLWVVFFRISGDDVQIVLDSIDLSTTPPTAQVKLVGSPLVQFSPGSHGNLPNHDVDPGEIVPIPTSIGLFNTELKPIPVPESLRQLAEDNGIDVPVDFPGFVGAAVVLMEEDNVSDSGAEAGHQALNSAIEAGIQEIIDTRSIENAGIDQSEIDAIASGISDSVRDAIADHQSWFQNVWSWLNSDDEIGHRVFFFSSDNLALTAPLQERWQNEGDWELTGLLSASPQCPAEAVTAVLAESDPESAKLDLDSLRSFRDRELSFHRGALSWWELVEKNKGQILLTMFRDKNAISAMSGIMAAAPKLVASTENVIGDELIEQARTFLTALSQSSVQRARTDASRSLELLNGIQGKTTIAEALRMLDETPPSKFPER